MNDTDPGACILLKEPIEARMRNMDLSEEDKLTKINSLNNLYGMLVIDAKARLGNISKIFTSLSHLFRISKKTEKEN